jgi:uncharacterized protein (DUF697 family)
VRDLEAIRAECLALVHQRARLSASATVVPIPGLDLVADLAVFSDLLQTISSRFGLSPQQLGHLPAHSREYALMLAGQLGSALIGRHITRRLAGWVLRKAGARWLSKSALKLVPLAGQAVAAYLSYRIACVIGEKHVEDCYRVAQALAAQYEPTSRTFDHPSQDTP